jgi:DNA polymerase (family 10)
LAEKIVELLNTEKLAFYEKLAAEIPVGLVEVLRVNGVGPKKAMLFYKELGITSVPDLETAARAGKLRDLAGMGAKSEQKIIEGIEALARRTDRVRIDIAMHAAEAILSELRSLPEVLKATYAGSLRRGRSTIGDVDLLIASENATPIMDRFVKRPDVARILGHGPTKSSVELQNGLQCDLRVIPPNVWGTALAYFTGSQAHNIRLRGLALEQGLSLNEWGFNPVNGGTPIECDTEEAVYATLGLPWIPPELREDRGEIEAAQNGQLPSLIQIGDVYSDLHMHTTWSDGALSIREMALIAKGRGLTHIVITDHSPVIAVANGLSIERLRAQREEIRAVDAEFAPQGFRVLAGTEVDILTDGTLDYPDEVLAELDLVVASLHLSLRQPRAQVTERLLKAIRNPHVDIIGHPRGQIIPDREGADWDMDAIFAAAKAHDTALEINSNPERLDLDDAHARRAVEMGIKIAIDTDSHSGGGFETLRYGVLTARRGWVRAENVINTLSTQDLLGWLRQRG